MENIFEYLIVIIPIAISSLALIISICTARKQNKIALFEKRYNCYTDIIKLISVMKRTVTITDDEISSRGFSHSHQFKDEDVLIYKFLFNQNTYKQILNISEISKEFSDIKTEKVVEENSNDKSKNVYFRIKDERYEKFKITLDKWNNIDLDLFYSKIEKQLKL